MLTIRRFAFAVCLLWSTQAHALVGQCRVNPVTGIAGSIYTSVTGVMTAANQPLANLVVAMAPGYNYRTALCALIEAIAVYLDTIGGGAHTDGQLVTWAQGAGAGQISFGAAAPNGTLVSAVGCDEGVLVTFTTGANTSTGAVFTVHYQTAFLHAPAVAIYAANDAAGHLLFAAEMHATATTTGLTFLTASGASPLSNTTYALHCISKGAK